MSSIKIRKLLNGGELAVIETRGLRRVVLHPSGVIVGDLYDISQAAAVLAFMPDDVKVISYPELAKQPSRKQKQPKAAKQKSRRKTSAA